MAGKRRETASTVRNGAAGHVGQIQKGSRWNVLASLFDPAIGSVSEIPERGVGLIESEADIPSFVVAPDDFGFGGAAGSGMDELNALV